MKLLSKKSYVLRAKVGESQNGQTLNLKRFGNFLFRFVDPPVVRWLLELQYHYEVECMTTLQAKRIPQYYKKKTSDILMVSESTNSVKTFQQKTKFITSEFLNLYE